MMSWMIFFRCSKELCKHGQPSRNNCIARSFLNGTSRDKTRQHNGMAGGKESISSLLPIQKAKDSVRANTETMPIITGRSCQIGRRITDYSFLVFLRILLTKDGATVLQLDLEKHIFFGGSFREHNRITKVYHCTSQLCLTGRVEKSSKAVCDYGTLSN